MMQTGARQEQFFKVTLQIYSSWRSFVEVATRGLFNKVIFGKVPRAPHSRGFEYFRSAKHLSVAPLRQTEYNIICVLM